MLGWRCSCKTDFIKLENKCKACGSARGSSNIHYRFQVRYKSHTGSCHTNDLAEARRIERAKQCEVEAHFPARGEKTMSEIAELVYDLVRRSPVKTGPNGREAGVRVMWKHLLRIFGPNTSATAASNPDAVVEYVRRRISEGVVGQTVSREVATLRRGLELAELPISTRWPNAYNCPELRHGKSHKGQEMAGHVISDIDGLLRWLTELPSEPRAVAKMALLTGMRATEIARMERSWMTETKNGWVISIPETGAKDGDARVIGASEEVVQIVAPRTQEGPIFPRVLWTETFGSAARRAGLGRAPHLRDLRKTHATIAVASGGQLHELREALGHTTLTQTSRYLGTYGTGATRVAEIVATELREAASVRA